MRRMFVLIVLGFVSLLGTSAALAHSESGSHGWSRQVLVLRSGPGDNYRTTGAIADNTAIKVLRCQALWCVVDGQGGRGWTRKVGISFGREPVWPILDADRTIRDLAGGSMCFYEGTHFTGRSFCAETGQVFPDLATLGWDNRIRSVRVTEPTSAALCRDRFFQSYCERLVESQPILDRLLSRQLSSIRMY